MRERVRAGGDAGGAVPEGARVGLRIARLAEPAGLLQGVVRALVEAVVVVRGGNRHLDVVRALLRVVGDADVVLTVFGGFCSEGGRRAAFCAVLVVSLEELVLRTEPHALALAGEGGVAGAGLDAELLGALVHEVAGGAARHAHVVSVGELEVRVAAALDADVHAAGEVRFVPAAHLALHRVLVVEVVVLRAGVVAVGVFAESYEVVLAAVHALL